MLDVHEPRHLRRRHTRGVVKCVLLAGFFFLLYTIYPRKSPAQPSQKIPRRVLASTSSLHTVARAAAAVVLSNAGPLNTSFLAETQDRHAASHEKSVESALVLQSFLDCLFGGGEPSSRGSDLYSCDPSEGWSNLFNGTDRLGIVSLSDHSSIICSHLRNKTMLLVGNALQYNLHDSLLRTLGPQKSNGVPYCPGREFCSWHEICTARNSSSAASHDHTPDRKKQLPPKNHPKSAVLRYSISTTLFPSANKLDPRFNTPYVSPHTGVREVEIEWWSRARASDVIVLSKGPISAPAWSYPRTTGTRADHLDFDVRSPTRRDSSFAHMQPIFEQLIQLGPPSAIPFASTTPIPHHIAHAAVKATMTIWLPSLLSTLVSLRSDPLTRSKLIVWRGESFVQPGCEEMGGARSSDNSAEASGLDVDTTYPWVLFYNVQVLLQSLILRDILPHVGIPYLPLPYAALLHPARDDLANPARFPREKTENLTREAHCATYDMDEAFLRGLARVLQTRS